MGFFAIFAIFIALPGMIVGYKIVQSQHKLRLKELEVRQQELFIENEKIKLLQNDPEFQREQKKELEYS